MTITNGFFNRLEGVWQNKVDGQWQDEFGWNFISQPELGGEGGNSFMMRFDQMRETITFKPRGIARNVGITGQVGFWQGMSYEVSIETPEGESIHHEMGHFLLNVKDKDGETHEELRGDVIRQATIPRANAIMTAGKLKPGTIADTIDGEVTPFYNTRPQARDAEIQNQINAAFDEKQGEITGRNGPNLGQPLEWLRGILAENPVGQNWVFEFRHDSAPSQMASGQRVANPVTIGNLLSDFWIGKREREGRTLEILQYAQKVDLTFHGIEWPHMAVNTLIKQS